MTTMNVNRLAHNVLSTDIKGTRSKIRGDLDLDALGRSVEQRETNRMTEGTAK